MLWGALVWGGAERVGGWFNGLVLVALCLWGVFGGKGSGEGNEEIVGEIGAAEMYKSYGCIEIGDS